MQRGKKAGDKTEVQIGVTNGTVVQFSTIENQPLMNTKTTDTYVHADLLETGQQLSPDLNHVETPPPPKVSCGTGRPRGGYKNKTGKRVPGVTTITGRFKDSGGLIHWAWQTGLDGLDINEVRDAAADAGTCGHEMIHSHVTGGTFDYSEWEERVWKQAEHCYLAYLEWATQSTLKVQVSEQPLVSEKYQFGGTLDAIYASNTLRLLDYKTSNAIYPEMLIQVAGGYSLLWQEHYPDQVLHGVDLLRISKPKHPDDPVSFEHRHFSAEVFPICQKAFIHMLELYTLDKRIKGLL